MNEFRNHKFNMMEVGVLENVSQITALENAGPIRCCRSSCTQALLTIPSLPSGAAYYPACTAAVSPRSLADLSSAN